MTNPTESEAQIRAAFNDLQHHADALPADDALAQITGARTRPPRWLLPIGGVAVAACALLFVLIVRSDDGDTQLDTAGPSSTTSTSAEPVAGPAPLTVAEDGYYPWIFPAPIASNFEEGCNSPADTVTAYLTRRGDTTAQVRLLDETADGSRFEVAARDADNQPSDQHTIVAIAPIEVNFAGCEAWGVVSAQAPGSVTVDSPKSDATVGTTIEVGGVGPETGSLTVEVADRDGTAGPDGKVFWKSDPAGPRQFTVTVELDETPADPNLTLTAIVDGQGHVVPPFAEVKVRYDGTPVDPSLPPTDDTTEQALDPFNFDYPLGNTKAGPPGATYPVRNGIYEGPFPGSPGELAEVSVVDARIGDWDHDGDSDALVVLREATVGTTGRFVSLRMLSDVGPDMHQTGEAFIDDRPVIHEFAPVTSRLGTDVQTTVSFVWRASTGQAGFFEGASAVGPNGSLSELTPVPLDPTAHLFLDGDDADAPIPAANGESLTRWATESGFGATQLPPANGQDGLRIDTDGQTLVTAALWLDGIPESICSKSPRVADGHGLRPAMTKADAEALVGPIDTRGDSQFAGRNEEFMIYRWNGEILTEICRASERF